MNINNVWQWLRDPDNRGALQIIGGLFAAIFTAVWIVFAYLKPPQVNSKIEKEISSIRKQPAPLPPPVEQKTVPASPTPSKKPKMNKGAPQQTQRDKVIPATKDNPDSKKFNQDIEGKIFPDENFNK
jgi:hypothetical protein